MRTQLRPVILSIQYFKQKVPLIQEVLIVVVLFLFHMVYSTRTPTPIGFIISKIKGFLLAKKKQGV